MTVPPCISDCMLLLYILNLDEDMIQKFSNQSRSITVEKLCPWPVRSHQWGGAAKSGNDFVNVFAFSNPRPAFNFTNSPKDPKCSVEWSVMTTYCGMIQRKLKWISSSRKKMKLQPKRLKCVSAPPREKITSAKLHRSGEKTKRKSTNSPVCISGRPYSMMSWSRNRFAKSSVLVLAWDPICSQSGFRRRRRI